MWHRPDTRKLPRAVGFITLCGECFTESAQAYGEAACVALVCYHCEEIAVERVLTKGRIVWH